MRDGELAVAHPDREQRLDPRRDPGGGDDGPRAAAAGCSPLPAQQRDRLGLVARVEGGEQVAEALAAGDPGGVHERGQPDLCGAVTQPGRAQPAGVQPRQAGPAGEGA